MSEGTPAVDVPLRMREISEIISRIQTSQPELIDAMSLAPRAKLPFKVVLIRAVTLCRLLEVATDAHGALEKGQLVTSAILTRSVCETAALVGYLNGLVSSALANGAVGDIDKVLMQISMGSRLKDAEHAAVNVLNMIDSIDKQFRVGLRGTYDRLSEVAHPNWSGNAFPYSTPNVAQRTASIGRGERYQKLLPPIVSSLSATLLMFEHVDGKLLEQIPAFVTLCEAQLGLSDN